VTFRLADSLPKAVLQRIHTRDSRNPNARRNAAREAEEFLDKAQGACFLQNGDVARVVSEAPHQFANQRYRLLAWCIMPNHVHAVFQPIKDFRLATIMHCWKSYTALAANRILGRKGPFWLREYYDHLLRSGEQLGRAIRYTAENPIKAGLKNWPWVYVSAEALGGEPLR
jgi:putative transposase